MFKHVIVGLLALSVAGCSFKLVRSEIRTTPESENHEIIEKRVTFMRMVEFVKTNQYSPPTERLKQEFHAMITMSGMRYSCYSGNACFLHKDNMKIQIHPEYVYIEFPDKSYRKIYDANDAVSVIYS